MLRFQKSLALLGSGGVTLGILNALDMVNFANTLTQLLASIISFFVAILFGGNPNDLLNGTNLTGGGAF